MASLRYLGAVLVCAVVLMAACDEETETNPSTANTTSTGGAGGASTSSSTGGMASSSSGMPACETTNLGLSCIDMVTDIDQSACSLLNQDCPDGRWCDIVGTASQCVQYSGGLKSHGVECSGDSECLAGLKCIDDKCSPFCCDTSEEPCCGGTCNLSVDFGGGVLAMMCSYQDACDLLLDNCPEPGEVCNPAVISAGQALCNTPSSTAVGEGEQGQYVNDCGESQILNSNLGDDCGPMCGICRQLCNVNSWMTDMVPTGGCPPNRECITVNWNNGGLWDHIGICLPPGGAGGSGGN